tara:strand:- start:18578 stop:20458 length:1881 start_codon:yes stop_codon:yes gene_type:complete
MSVIETLTEGIRTRSLASEGEALLKKWERTGLLEGLNDVARTNMSRLLENQAAQLLRETSTMSGGNVEGFAAVAFPIVRRVFGNLIAQELVSVQPMSLPSGLIFFLDFTYSANGTQVSAEQFRLGDQYGSSLYGGGVLGQQLTGGVNLGGASGSDRSFYGLNNGYASPTGSTAGIAGWSLTIVASGTYGDAASQPGGAQFSALRSDPTFQSGAANTVGSTAYLVATTTLAAGAAFPNLNRDNLVTIALSGGAGATQQPGGGIMSRISGAFQVRHLNAITPAGFVQMVFAMPSYAVHTVGNGNSTNSCAGFLDAAARGGVKAGGAAINAGLTASFGLIDTWQAGTGVPGSVAANVLQLENNARLPEIDIRVDSVAVTAISKKLKAKWTPELAQDLNAYHNLDAEVELTSILSEQIALEIDQEIIQDLIAGATAATLYWSRSPGKFLNRETGQILGTVAGNTVAVIAYPDFTGTVSEWYETLLETVNDVSARIHRKTLRGGGNVIVTSPEVAGILEFTSGFRASVGVDDEKGSWGVKNVGSISRKMDIMVDPYFPRNLILVARKGSSFLESGYVYAPYVPLQVTPTIFGTEDFVPRKGVMTRYAKKMVRPDMYGLVVVADLVADAPRF